jgi:hypothetical protein
MSPANLSARRVVNAVEEAKEDVLLIVRLGRVAGPGLLQSLRGEVGRGVG